MNQMRHHLRQATVPLNEHKKSNLLVHLRHRCQEMTYSPLQDLSSPSEWLQQYRTEYHSWLHWRRVEPRRRMLLLKQTYRHLRVSHELQQHH